ncbi:unnamed protein product, partial [Porites evermanni]
KILLIHLLNIFFLQWLPLPAVAGYRILVALYCVSWIIYSIILDNTWKWLIFLTDWTFLCVTTYFTCSSVISVIYWIHIRHQRVNDCCTSSDCLPVERSDISNKEQISNSQYTTPRQSASDTNESSLLEEEYYDAFEDTENISPAERTTESNTARHSSHVYACLQALNYPQKWYHKVSWAFYIIAANNSLLVTVVYWSLLYSGFHIREADVAFHLLNSVFMLIETCLSSIPVQLLHIVYAVLYGVVYFLFSVVYWLLGGTTDGNKYIYPILDYESKPAKAAVVIVLYGFIGLPWFPDVGVTIYRCVFAGYCLGWIIYSGFHLSNGDEKWFIYLTNWSFAFLTLYFILAFVVCVFNHIRDTPNETAPVQMTTAKSDGSSGISIEVANDQGLNYEQPAAKMAWYHKALWVIFIIAANAAILVTLLYWTLIFTGKTSGLDISTHLINSLFIVADVMLSETPVRFLHFLYAWIYGACYVLMTVIFWASNGTNALGDPYIYSYIDYDESPALSSGIVVGFVLLGQPFVQAILFGLFKLRGFSVYVYVLALHTLERLRFTFTVNVNLYHARDQVLPLIVVNCLLLLLKNNGFHLTVERDWFWFWFWFYYALWLASVFTLVLLLRQSSENRSNQSKSTTSSNKEQISNSQYTTPRQSASDTNESSLLEEEYYDAFEDTENISPAERTTESNTARHSSHVYACLQALNYPQKWYHKVSWAFYIIAANNSLLVTVVYWSLLYSGFHIREADVAFHLLNSVFMLIETCLSSIPVQLLHIVYAVLYGVVYFLFSVVYWLLGGTTDGNKYIYPILDYESKPAKAAVVIVLYGFIGLPVAQLLIFGLFKLRCYLKTLRRQ